MSSDIELNMWQRYYKSRSPLRTAIKNLEDIFSIFRALWAQNTPVKTDFRINPKIFLRAEILLYLVSQIDCGQTMYTVCMRGIFAGISSNIRSCTAYIHNLWLTL
jgi:hypothetical protein